MPSIKTFCAGIIDLHPTAGIAQTDIAHDDAVTGDKLQILRVAFSAHDVFDLTAAATAAINGAQASDGNVAALPGTDQSTRSNPT